MFVGRVIALVAALSALLVTFTVQAASTSKPAAGPEVRSQAALVVDIDSGEILFARKADIQRPIASLTKLMTALIVMEGGQSLDEYVELTREDRTGTPGAASRLQPGMRLTRGDLLRLALMSSDNRAAHAMGRTYPGGMTAFIKAMNAKARLLGMQHTRFVDASGLGAGNVSSATDIYKLTVAVSSHAAIREYSTDGKYSVALAKHSAEFRNTNYLVTKPDWDIQVQKTGYTSQAGQCLTMSTVIQGRRLAIVLLDSFGKYTRTADARRIRKWLEARASQTLARATH